MKISYAAALVLAAISAPAVAQTADATAASATPAAVKRGALIFSSDGSRVGRVDRVRADSIGLIFQGKYVDLPTSTLTASGKGFTTNLTRSQLVSR